MSPRNSHGFSYFTALVLAIAAGIGCVTVSVMAYTIYEEFANSRAWKNVISTPRETLSVTASGTPVIVVNDRPVLDADRQPFAEPPDEPLLKPAQINRWDRRAGYAASERYQSDRQRVRQVGYDPSPDRWYFLLPERGSNRGYFVCYDRETRLAKDYLGRSGFQSDPPSEQFDVHPASLRRWSIPGLVEWENLQRLYGDYNDARVTFRGDYLIEKSQLIFRSDDETFLIDFEQRTLETVSLPQNAYGLGWVGQLTELPVPEADEVFRHERSHLLTMSLVALAPSRLVLFHPREEARLEFILPEEADDDHAQYFLSGENQLVVLISARNRELIEPGIGEVDTKYLRITPSGEILERKSLTHRFPMIISDLNEDLGFNLLVLTVPGTLTSGTIAGLFLPFVMQHSEQTFGEAQSKVLSTTWPALLIATLLSAALCVLVERRQQAYHLPRNYGWLLFVFLLGFPGYIGYLLHRKWPLKEQPKVPVLTGREIFA